MGNKKRLIIFSAAFILVTCTFIWYLMGKKTLNNKLKPQINNNNLNEDKQKLNKVVRDFKLLKNSTEKKNLLIGTNFDEVGIKEKIEGWEVIGSQQSLDISNITSDSPHINKNTLSLKIPPNSNLHQQIDIKQKVEHFFTGYFMLLDGSVRVSITDNTGRVLFTKDLSKNDLVDWQQLNYLIPAPNQTPILYNLNIASENGANIKINYISFSEVAADTITPTSLPFPSPTLTDDELQDVIHHVGDVTEAYSLENGEWGVLSHEVDPEKPAADTTLGSLQNFSGGSIDSVLYISTQSLEILNQQSNYFYSILINNLNQFRSSGVDASFQVDPEIVVFNENIPSGCRVRDVFYPDEFCRNAPPLRFAVASQMGNALGFSLVAQHNIAIKANFFTDAATMRLIVFHELGHTLGFLPHYYDAYKVVSNEVNGKTYTSPYINTIMGGANSNLGDHVIQTINHDGSLSGHGPSSNNVPRSVRLSINGRNLSPTTAYIYLGKGNPGRDAPSTISQQQPIVRNVEDSTLDLSNIDLFFINMISLSVDDIIYYGWIDTAEGNLHFWNGSEWNISLTEDDFQQPTKITWPTNNQIIYQRIPLEIRGRISRGSAFTRYSLSLRRQDDPDNVVWNINKSNLSGNTLASYSDTSNITFRVIPGMYVVRLDVERAGLYVTEDEVVLEIKENLCSQQLDIDTCHQSQCAWYGSCNKCGMRGMPVELICNLQIQKNFGIQ